MSLPALTLPLRLTPAAPDGAPIAAWYLSGGDPLDWLEEICAWQNVPQTAIRLCLLPRSADGPTPAGVLAILPSGTAAPDSRRAQPYRLLLDRLYLPLDAQLDPPVSDDELAHLSPPSQTYVFHPGIGLCVFRDSDLLGVADLLTGPPVSAQNWQGAHPGSTTYEGSLRSVHLEIGEDLDDLFGDAADGIGRSGDDTDDNPLPPVPGEPATGLVDNLIRGIQQRLAKAALGFAKSAPRSPDTAPGWANRLGDWAARRLNQLGDELNKIRNRELNRLLHLLENDPAAGLRHAIPLGGGAGRRGRAEPSSRLGSNDPNFRLDRLRGGRAGDAWNVAPDLHARLRERYRQLANEEMRLGRFRRAAYIHAELLGDLASAASCLKEGRHFHEAAVLYRDHLNRPLDAAECLAAAGEYPAAVSIYETHDRFLQAAELYILMGDGPRAAAAYRREVDRLVTADDLLGAATLLEDKLGFPDKALAVLKLGWPASRQAGLVLARTFESLGRRGAHAEASALLAELAGPAPTAATASLLAGQLATAQAAYPDETVRHAARDLSRVTVARRLPHTDAAEAKTLVGILARLVPQDRLLARDGDRYAARRAEEERRAAEAAFAATPKLGNGKLPLTLPDHRAPQLVRTWQLQKGVRWQAVCPMGDCFYAAGTTADSLTLTRHGWEGGGTTIQLEKHSTQCFNARPPFLLLAVPLADPSFVVCVLAAGLMSPFLPRPPVKTMPRGTMAWDVQADCGQPGWWPNGVLAAAFTDHGALWLLRENFTDGESMNTEFLLSCYRRDGTLITQFSAGPEFDEVAGRPMSGAAFLAVVGGRVITASMERLVIHQDETQRTAMDLDGNITGLVPTPAHARNGCAVCLENGVAFVWTHHPQSVMTVAAGIARPLAVFTRAGNLVVLSTEDNQGQVFEIVRGEARAVADFQWKGGDKVVALTSTVFRNGFAVTDEEGLVQIFKC